ncbi:zinc ribbon-containing protein [Halomonadaceae bacterium KBTZ08]
MAEKQRPRLSDGAEKSYNRMLERVESRLAEAEERTWEQLQQEIEEAVEFEQEVTELTRDELNLLSTYLRRDLSHLLGFVSGTGDGVAEWLRVDLELIEDWLVDRLLSIADPTRLDTLELQQKLQDTDPDHYFAGELAMAGVLRCLNCGRMRTLAETTRLEPCEWCESHYFERVTAHTPDVDPSTV